MRLFFSLLLCFVGILMFSQCNEKPDLAPQSADFRTFPNPVSDYIRVTIINSKSESFNLKIFDTRGKIIFEKAADDQNADYTISVSGMEKGTYQAVLNKGGVTITNKLFKL